METKTGNSVLADGEGRRLFEHLGAEQVELEPLRVLEGAGVTHLRYRVRR
jgi:hypothetical protein